MKPLQYGAGISLKDVRIHSPLWSKVIELIHHTVLPYQWEALNDRVADAVPSYAVHNFEVAAGLKDGEFCGMLFQDSDLAKWLEAAAYRLQTHPDPELEQTTDALIELIEKAQLEDGYLNTYFQLKAPDRRWTNLYECHELYCAGHMMEAAVAYYEATGKDKLLKVMKRMADHIDQTIGPEPGKLPGYPGHQEIELALVKLYRATREVRYLHLAKYFIDARGQAPHFFDDEWERRGRISEWSHQPSGRPSKAYNQSHLPVREQTEAVGHAVRAVYMYAGMADIAVHTGDTGLLDACRRIWDNIVSKQMYITGGIGATHHGEAFTFDYDLPNDTIYAETCASIGLIFFARRMLLAEPKADYADVMERVLYNIVLASMALDGRHFFYVNPLEVWPAASEQDPGKHHVRPIRQKWFGCACCPPNLARLLTALGDYVYSVHGNTLYAHLYIGGEMKTVVGNQQVSIVQETNYPWDGEIKLVIQEQVDHAFGLALRIPGWCRKVGILVNGEAADTEGIINNGYAVIERFWSKGDTVVLSLQMPVEAVYAKPSVRENTWKAALQRGPLVYCLEEADNGANLPAMALCADAPFNTQYRSDLMGGTVVIEGTARRLTDTDPRSLYQFTPPDTEFVHFTAIPYFLWGNRKPGEMLVWLHMR